MTETYYVTPEGNPTPAPVLCARPHPVKLLPCEWRAGHENPHSIFVVTPRLNRRGANFVVRLDWTDQPR